MFMKEISEISLRSKLFQLLETKRVHWKKRYTVRWTKFGDASTSFFHAAATKHYRINTITSFIKEDGSEVTSHHEKAAALWEEYKTRLGVTSTPTMLFDLDDLVQQRDLDHLNAPFSKEDIDKVVKEMPADKAPGPDGFNGLFIKRCWPIIKDDVYRTCLDFFAGLVDLSAINNSYITLVPKVNKPYFHK